MVHKPRDIVMTRPIETMISRQIPSEIPCSLSLYRRGARICTGNFLSSLRKHWSLCALAHSDTWLSEWIGRKPAPLNSLLSRLNEIIIRDLRSILLLPRTDESLNSAPEEGSIILSHSSIFHSSVSCLLWGSQYSHGEEHTMHVSLFASTIYGCAVHRHVALSGLNCIAVKEVMQWCVLATWDHLSCA